MGELTETIELTYEHRELLLKYGYPFERLEASPRRQGDCTGIYVLKMTFSM